MEFKIIQDPLNGPIKVSSDILEIIDSPEFQRLRYVRQLGMCHLIFPGANHTRFEHSLGTMYLAQMFADALSVENPMLLTVSPLLPDIGHPPLSHGIESVFSRHTGMDHLDAGIGIILGKRPFEESSIPGILESMGMSPRDVADVLLFKNPKNRLLSRIISGPIDADELDYLRRDSLYTGVSIGNVDHRRVLNVAIPHKDDVTIAEKGVSTLESVLIARILMYGSVYFHKTSRIAQTMAGYAVEGIIDQFQMPFTMTDDALFGILARDDRKISRAVLRRELYKPIFKTAYTPDSLQRIKETLASDRSLEPTSYIVDVIPPLEFTGPGRIKSDMHVKLSSGLVDITEVSPLIRTLRDTLENKQIVVSADGHLMERVRSRIEKIA